jgi:hypothetical protein
MTIATRSMGTSSSSATICANAVPMPMPASILPTPAVTEPSAAMRIHESSVAASIFAGHAPGAGGAAARARSGIANDTTSAPPPFRNSRRVISGTQLLLRTLHRAKDAHVSPAAALESRKAATNVLIRGARVVPEQRRGGHDPAAEAVAALRRLLLDERLTQRRERRCPLQESPRSS